MRQWSIGNQRIDLVHRVCFQFRSAKDLNKAMHIKHGNTAAKHRTWQQKHGLRGRSPFLIGTYNVGGLQQATKRSRLKDNADILGITETHLQSHLEHSESTQFDNYHCFWSPNPEDRHFSGIGILIKKSAFWAASAISWAPEDACHRFFKDNRLLATQVWFGHGGTSLLVYTCYGPSGARWEADKKTYFHQLIQAIEHDRIQRGDLPAILIGDFNLQISDSSILAGTLQRRFWYDTRDKAAPHMQKAATCHKGKGSYIDHVWVSQNLYDLTDNFVVQKHDEFKDHAFVACTIAIPSPSQTIKNLRPVTKLPVLLSPPSLSDSRIPCRLSPEFHTVIASGDVNVAFKLWSQEFERVLFDIANHQHHQLLNKAPAKRGQITFQEQRKFPRTVNNQASTLKTRKLWKAHCQLLEITKVAPGTRRDRTIANLRKVEQWLTPDQHSELATLIDRSEFVTALQLLDNFLESSIRIDKQQRILQWKRKMRTQANKPFEYLRHKASCAPVKVSQVEGNLTANIPSRLDSISQVWKTIFASHIDGEPSFSNFMDRYGSTMKTHKVVLGDLQPDHISQVLRKMKASAPGLDQTLVSELKIASQWSPSLMNSLATLFNCIEQLQTWPHVLTQGVVSFIPKDPSNHQPKPDEFRPITILSSIYRLWAASRHSQLARKWYPLWKHENAFGGKYSRSADQLAYETCMQLEAASSSDMFAAGVSFDLQKCFDTVPCNLALDVFQQRGADPRLVQTLRSFYKGHTKLFRLEGHHSQSFRPSCGIIQGCPLSMLLLTSLVTAWLEHIQVKIPVAISRSYADDMSAVAVGNSKPVVKQALTQVYEHTQQFSTSAGMTINKHKSFTFGSKDFRGCVAAIPDHAETFRLVGCSVKTKAAKHWTPLEDKRYHDWKVVIQRIRNIPISWHEKVHLIRTMMTKLTFGQGLHSLHVPKDTAPAMRATVIRTLFNVDNYNSAPNAVFALLTPPAADPLFALDLSAFQLIQRMYPTDTERKQLLQSIRDASESSDGPVQRAKQLSDSAIFGATMKNFLQGNLHPAKWEHDLREAYRSQAWQLLCRDRPQHFAGISNGVDRTRTSKYLNALKSEADLLQSECDKEETINPEPLDDPRVKLKVLRLLLTGGLQTPERQHRHKNKPGQVQCLCKTGEPTIQHIAWHCPRFAHIRNPILEKLPMPLENLPRCFTCCAIIPSNLVLPVDDVVLIQEKLVQFWQHHIADWHNGDENFMVIYDGPVTSQSETHPNATASNQPSSSTAAPAAPPQPVPKNGHVLKLLPEGGVFCQLCGKSTKLLKHQRLKILSRPCKNPNLPPDQWLTSPGAFDNAPRLEKAWLELLQKHNKPNHLLFWNQKCGKKKINLILGNCGVSDVGKSGHGCTGTTIYLSLNATRSGIILLLPLG